MKKPQFDLEGKCALITGASGGIGLGHRPFVRQGRRQACCLRHKGGKAQVLCEELKRLGAVCSDLVKT